jgi:hypothetical protein
MSSAFCLGDVRTVDFAVGSAYPYSPVTLVDIGGCQWFASSDSVAAMYKRQGSATHGTYVLVVDLSASARAPNTLI